MITYMTPHRITVYSLDGELLRGEYTFTGRMKDKVKVSQPMGVLTEEFNSVDERTSSYGSSQLLEGRLEPCMGLTERQLGARPANASA